MKGKVVYMEGFEVRDVIKGLVISDVTLLSLFSLLMFSTVGELDMLEHCYGEGMVANCIE